MAQLRSDPPVAHGSSVALGWRSAVEDAPARGTTTPSSGNGAGPRSSRPWPLAASHLLLPLAAVALGVIAAVGHARLGLVAPIVVAALGLVVALARHPPRTLRRSAWPAGSGWHRWWRPS